MPFDLIIIKEDRSEKQDHMTVEMLMEAKKTAMKPLVDKKIAYTYTGATKWFQYNPETGKWDEEKIFKKT